MSYNVYALLERRDFGRKQTFDLYKVCPSYEDALDVYREKFGEPETIRGPVDEDSWVWILDEDSTGAAYIARYTLEGELEEA